MAKQQQKSVFAIAVGTALLLLAGAKRWVSPKQVSFQAGNGEWGESVDGISCRIGLIQEQGFDGDYADYYLTAEVRNLSDEALRVLCFVDQKAANGYPALKVPPLTWLMLQMENRKRDRFGAFEFPEGKDIIRLPAKSTNAISGKVRISKSDIQNMPSGAVLKLNFGGLDPHGRDKADKAKYWSQAVESGAVKVLSAK